MTDGPTGRRATSRRGTGAALRIDLVRSVRAWSPGARSMREWAGAALGRCSAGREIAVRIVGPAESRRLNARWRGKDKPTNVLSFPAAPVPAAAPAAAPLGDLVICAQVVRAEAREQGKRLRDHWAHLVVHGVLHLAGYDHEHDRDAVRMERREASVLRRFGIPNPYRIAAS
jgi:probable rRNA maturation factor